MYTIIKIKSNNKASLKKCMFFLKKMSDKFSFSLIKQHGLTIRDKTFTVLRSPHVNNRSGEHFKYSIFQINIIVCSTNLNLKVFIYLLKKLKQLLYTDIVITIKNEFKNSHRIHSNSFFFNPDNLFLSNELILSYVKSWDNFGEICFKKTFFSKI